VGRARSIDETGCCTALRNRWRPAATHSMGKGRKFRFQRLVILRRARFTRRFTRDPTNVSKQDQPISVNTFSKACVIRLAAWRLPSAFSPYGDVVWFASAEDPQSRQVLEGEVTWRALKATSRLHCQEGSTFPERITPRSHQGLTRVRPGAQAVPARSRRTEVWRGGLRAVCVLAHGAVCGAPKDGVTRAAWGSRRSQGQGSAYDNAPRASGKPPVMPAKGGREATCRT